MNEDIDSLLDIPVQVDVLENVYVIVISYKGDFKYYDSVDKAFRLLEVETFLPTYTLSELGVVLSTQSEHITGDVIITTLEASV